VVSVTVNEGTIGELSRHLYAMDVAVRAGFHCAPWAHRHLGTTNRGGAIRFSISPFNTEQEMEDVIRIVKEVLHG
jgi:selenocysteine lyase/cysteine desulfurase